MNAPTDEGSGVTGLMVRFECRILSARSAVSMLARWPDEANVLVVKPREDGSLETAEDSMELARLLVRMAQSDRRPGTSTGSELSHRRGLVVRPIQQSTMYRNQPIAFTASEFSLLIELMTRQDEVLSPDVLADAVWGYELIGNPNFVQAHISRMRKKLQAVGCPALIATVRSRGYVIRDVDSPRSSPAVPRQPRLTATQCTPSVRPDGGSRWAISGQVLRPHEGTESGDMSSELEPPAGAEEAPPLDPVGASRGASERDRASYRAGGLATSRLQGPSGLELRLDSREVVVGDATTELTPQEFEVLRILLERADTVVTADDLSQRAWGHSLDGNRSFMDSLMSRLRSDLGRLGLTNVIHTVRGVGYRIPMPKQSGLEASSFPSLLDSLTVGVLLVDFDHHILFANEAAEQLTGYSNPELLALPTALLLVPDEAAINRRVMADEARAGRRGGWVDSVIRRKDRERIRVVASIVPSFDDDGAPNGTIHEFHADASTRNRDVGPQDGEGTDGDSAASGRSGSR